MENKPDDAAKTKRLHVVSGGTGDYIGRENREIQLATARQNIEELRRQRVELSLLMGEKVQEIERRRQMLDIEHERAIACLTGIEKAPVLTNPDDVAATRELRRAIEAARIELARIDAINGTQNESKVPFANLSFRDWLIAASAFSLCIAIPLIVAAVIIALTIKGVFQV